MFENDTRVASHENQLHISDEDKVQVGFFCDSSPMFETSVESACENENYMDLIGDSCSESDGVVAKGLPDLKKYDRLDRSAVLAPKTGRSRDSSLFLKKLPESTKLQMINSIFLSIAKSSVDNDELSDAGSQSLDAKKNDLNDFLENECNSNIATGIHLPLNHDHYQTVSLPGPSLCSSSSRMSQPNNINRSSTNTAVVVSGVEQLQPSFATGKSGSDESNIVSSSNIKIRPVKKESGKRNRNKFPCNYCEKSVSEYARHLRDCHSDKKAVAAILIKTKKERKKEFDLLRQKSIRRHNVEVLDKEEGELIVSRRSVLRQVADDYLPCPTCNMMFSPKQLNRHYKFFCRSQSNQPIQGGVVRQAKVIMEVGLNSNNLHSGYYKDVLGTLQRDAVAKVAKRDSLIVLFGQSLYTRKGKCRSTEIAGRLRLLARMVMSINELQSPPVTLMECISGQHFDHVLAAVEDLCGVKTDATGRSVFEKPSLGTKLGHSLVKCARIKKREAIKSGSKRMEAEADAFLSLHQSDWGDSISSRALMTMKMNRLKGPELLPQTDDLVKLKEYVDDTIKHLVAKLEVGFSWSAYRNLLEYTLSALILFNKRRGGEASKLLLEGYTNRQKWNHASNKEIIASLTEVEKKLVQRIDLVHIPAKNSRVVPMLLLPRVKKAMDLLVTTRQQNNITPQNPFFFASESRNGHLYQYKVLRKISEKANLEKPELIRSTKLRKYLATMAQIVNLTQGEQEWLSNHLGHEIHIDKDFYRSNDAILEVSKISRLLMVADCGKMAQYAGKPLADISVEESYFNQSEPHHSTDDEICPSDEEEIGERTESKSKSKGKRKENQHSFMSDIEPSDNDDADCSIVLSGKRQIKSKRLRAGPSHEKSSDEEYDTKRRIDRKVEISERCCDGEASENGDSNTDNRKTSVKRQKMSRKFLGKSSDEEWDTRRRIGRKVENSERFCDGEASENGDSNTDNRKTSLKRQKKSRKSFGESSDEEWDTRRRIGRKVENSEIFCDGEASENGDSNTHNRKTSVKRQKKSKKSLGDSSDEENDKTWQRSDEESSNDDDNYKTRAKIKCKKKTCSIGETSSMAGDKTTGQRKRPEIRVKWSSEELKILKKFLCSSKPPKEDEIRSVLDKFPILSKRSIAQIKSRAWHLFKTGR